MIKKEADKVKEGEKPSFTKSKKKTESPTASAKPTGKFELIDKTGKHTVLPGIGHVKFGGGDWVSPGRKLYRDISKSQKDLEAVYNIGPGMKKVIKAPEGYKARWEKLG
jgi:hypothetical protein